jgi:hypothetical protein
MVGGGSPRREGGEGNESDVMYRRRKRNERMKEGR